ncbi:transposase [Oxynema sp. CENA135]|uniref:RNA-guided endonuclease InsQ/TnpB family protein n=1 Tax=Oxynema sp. CENA135 TaxID=984206 RepID=UPI00190BEC78|nr:RNA-guided endonuclease TnpB family protein [Oxynema sp. CENA135]MBK4728621.1 transposase [Oxynema sp. CENA135]
MLTINYTYRIYPNTTQQTELLEWIETCRGVYNYALRELKDWMASRKCPADRCSLEKEYTIPADELFPSYHRQQNNLPKAKKQFPHLGKVHSQVLQTTIRRVYDTWEAFQKRGYGFPRFNKLGQFKSFVFPQLKNNPISGHTIKLPTIGKVPINLHRSIPNGFALKSVRVGSKVRGTQWYAVVTITSDVSVPEIEPRSPCIGIDLGLERFLMASDSSVEESPQCFESMQSKLKLLQHRAARKQKGSKNWEKAQLAIARVYHRIANRRQDFHLKTAHKLCDRAQTIFAEDLNVKGLRRGMLREDCVDAAFGQFLSLTEGVCWKRGVYFAKVDPNGTRPNCFAMVSKGLNVREHHCPDCRDRTHRDTPPASLRERVAAEMVLHRGLEPVSRQRLWENESACQVGLSGVDDLDRWRGARTSNREIGKPALYL